MFLCADVDECVIEKPCGQLCTNLPGRYRCHCRVGFQLQEDGQSCRRNGRFAKFETYDRIFRRILLRADFFQIPTKMLLKHAIWKSMMCQQQRIRRLFMVCMIQFLNSDKISLFKKYKNSIILGKI